MSNSWPNKTDREQYEIKGFFQTYQQAHPDRHFEIVTKSEKPDYIVKDVNTGEIFGVELTSVYMNNRSVPDEHIPAQVGEKIEYNLKQINDYLVCLVNAVKEKISKAHKHYDTSMPLILSVYVNEYISIYITERHLQKMVRDHPEVFDKMSPFLEIVFWPLSNNSVFCVR